MCRVLLLLAISSCDPNVSIQSEGCIAAGRKASARIGRTKRWEMDGCPRCCGWAAWSVRGQQWRWHSSLCCKQGMWPSGSLLTPTMM
ncbi:hypothetical protein GOP47_0024433 [Adiantum capillus-veneris]|uniref:Secreted protein n=1 Tax=Adiantum capillus-veneris TaxID=13818 RepID=A0A9D4U248_ADICA|nr:hypothetical protein GOP47_0024433 [Adiantum capillus-veneris]